MKEHSHKEEWREGDETWQLLGKSVPKRASARFADDVVRAVRLLPEADPVWPRILKFSRWAVVAACVVFTASILIDPLEKDSSPATGQTDQPKPSEVSAVATANNEVVWQQIEDVAHAELLAAAADHLEEFSDRDLVTMMGF
jgi:hypothetical protein